MSASKTATHAPLRSLDQRMDALKRANDVRVRRAKLKKDLKDGRVRIETILANPPEYVSTAKVIDILMAVPKFGRVKAARMLNQCRISQSKTVGGLSDRQRQELIALFNRWETGLRPPGARGRREGDDGEDAARPGSRPPARGFGDHEAPPPDRARRRR